MSKPIFWGKIRKLRTAFQNSEEANWSGAALFVIKYMNLYQQPGSGYLIGWKLEVGMAS